MTHLGTICVHLSLICHVLSAWFVRLVEADSIENWSAILKEHIASALGDAAARESATKKVDELPKGTTFLQYQQAAFNLLLGEVFPGQFSLLPALIQKAKDRAARINRERVAAASRLGVKLPKQKVSDRPPIPLEKTLANGRKMTKMMQAYSDSHHILHNTRMVSRHHHAHAPKRLWRPMARPSPAYSPLSLLSL